MPTPLSLTHFPVLGSQASKNAIVTAVADASSIVFAQTCASAQAKLDGLVNLLQVRRQPMGKGWRARRRGCGAKGALPEA